MPNELGTFQIEIVRCNVVTPRNWRNIIEYYGIYFARLSLNIFINSMIFAMLIKSGRHMVARCVDAKAVFLVHY